MTRDARHLVIIAALLLITLLVHGRAIGYGFCVSDDVPQIVNNPTLQWKNAPDYFVKDVWRNPQPQFRLYYRPVFLLWLLLNFKLFGLHPALWHLAAILLHGVVVVMVYRLGLRLMGNELIAAAAALLFAVDPTHVESVVWISGVTEPLMAAFVLGGFLCYLRWRETQARGTMLLCALLTLAALLAKETSAALPLLIALYEWLFPRAQGDNVRARMKGVVRAAGPGFAAAAVYGCMRLYAMNHVVFANNAPAKVLMTWPLALWEYARMMFWPLGLAMFYDVRILKQPSIWNFWLPTAFVIGCAALLAFAFVRNKLAAFLGCWWLLPIVPALIGIFSFLEADIVHDRYTYLSSVGFVLLLAWGLSRLPRSGREAFGLPAEVLGVLVVLVCVGGVLTARQTQVWENGITLYAHSVEVSPKNVRARNLLANQFFKMGDVGRALAFYDSSLRLEPNLWETNFALGVTLASVDQLPQGESFLRRARALDSKNPQTYLALAAVLRAENQPDEARQVLSEGLLSVDESRDVLQEKLGEIDSAK
jgi:tetratricopeptide (TPR) repeat protein